MFFSLDLLDVVFELILCSSVSPSLYSKTVEPPRDQGTGGLGLDGRDGHAEGARGHGAASGKLAGSAAAASRPPAQWAMELSALQSTLAQQHAQRLQILQSATWRTLATQSRWDLWFAQQAKHLETEVARYREALQENASQDPAQIEQD